MKAAIINKWGSPDVFKITNIPRPEPADDQILIKVFASSVNPVDYKHRLGNHRLILGAPFPIVLGYDVCGEVVKSGRNISKFKTGDIVFGDLDNKYGGALGEFALGREHCFALKPPNISVEEAAAFPLVALTAYQALKYKANLQSGQGVIINGASGGVGHLAIQIANIMGARVTAIASGKNKAFVEGYNPDVFLDYQQYNITESDMQTNVFFDTIGNYSFAKTRHMLHPGGTYVSTLPRLKVLFHKLLQPVSKGKRVKTLIRKHNGQDLDQIARWISDGKLKIHIDRVFNLDEIADAHRYIETGRTKGKNVIVIK